MHLGLRPPCSPEPGLYQMIRSLTLVHWMHLGLRPHPAEVVLAVLAAFASVITFSISACFKARLHLATT